MFCTLRCDKSDVVSTTLALSSSNIPPSVCDISSPTVSFTSLNSDKSVLKIVRHAIFASNLPKFYFTDSCMEIERIFTASSRKYSNNAFSNSVDRFEAETSQFFNRIAIKSDNSRFKLICRVTVIKASK